MIIGWFLQLLSGFFSLFLSTANPHQFDFHFSQNTNLLAFISYMMQADHFFPIDTYLVIGGLYSLIYALGGGLKVFEVVINVVRGSGLKI